MTTKVGPSTLANTAVTAGDYGSASTVGWYTVDAQGRITGAGNTSIAITSSAVSGLATSATTDTSNAANITSGTLSSSRLPTSGVTTGTYTGAANTKSITVDTYGRVTSISNVAIAITSSQVSGLATSATTDTTNASNISTGTLPSGRLSGSYTITASSATNANNLTTSNFSIVESGGVLLVKYGTTTIVSITSDGTVTAANNVIAGGTP